MRFSFIPETRKESISNCGVLLLRRFHDVKKSIYALLSLALLTTSTAYAVNADTSASIPYDILPHEESSSIEITKSDGELLEYEVEYTDNSVITTHHDGATTTKVEAIYKTGEIITSVYVDGRLQSQNREINESVKKANQATKIAPPLVLPHILLVWYCHGLSATLQA